MDPSRREFLTRGGQVAGAGVLGVLAAESTAEAKEGMKPMVAACGLACIACPLMKAKKCKGCATGKTATPALLAKKPCPVLQCAAKKKIDYCGTGCKMFTQCKKMIGKPYAQSFMDMLKKRLG